MTTGFQVLAKGTFTGNQAAVVFTNIDQSYSHLQFEITARGSAAQTRVNLHMNINQVTTGSKYRLLGTQVQSSSSGTAEIVNGIGPTNDPAFLHICGNTVQANQLTAVEALIPNYSSTSFSKVAFGKSNACDQSGSGANAKRRYVDMVYQDTSAITSISWNTGGTGYFIDGGTYIMGAWK